MTHEDIGYDRGVRPIEYDAKIGNVAEARRVFGVSRDTSGPGVWTAPRRTSRSGHRAGHDLGRCGRSPQPMWPPAPRCVSSSSATRPPPSPAAFPDHLKKALRKHGITLEGVLTDDGPESIGKVRRSGSGRELGRYGIEGFVNKKPVRTIA